MRRIVLATLFASLSSLAYAQMDAPRQGSTPSTPSSPPTASIRPAPGTASSAENCGTPDEYKACPPLPRRNLPYYPANKH